MIPSAKSESLEKLPPEKVLSRLRMPPPPKLSLQFLDRVDVHAGRGDVGAEPVEQEHRRGEGELLANVGDAEGVRNSPEH